LRDQRYGDERPGRLRLRGLGVLIMTNMALVVGGVAVNVCDSTVLAESFHPEIAAQFVDVPDDVAVGWIETGGTWAAPPTPPPPPGPPTTMVIDVPTFFMRFTPQEESAIRASTDPIVIVFLRRIDDVRTTRVNLALEAVQQGVGYLSTTTPPLIASDRVAQILAPEPV
jgi:hypothetical protein